jgi:hypothetical protein
MPKNIQCVGSVSVGSHNLEEFGESGPCTPEIGLYHFSYDGWLVAAQGSIEEIGPAITVGTNPSFGR